MAHTRHDDTMVPVDVGAVGDMGRRFTGGRARCYGADAAVLDGHGVGIEELTTDEVDVVDDERWIIANFHLSPADSR